ncbi:hypothetical protein [Paraburkholderia sp. DHOC27]|uniref:hypothetical protein n=1 Tax=Paraburkholderia sp. DHOC27 TaxID=2303330 RepID=UPI000E3C2FC9|nr:hypothetical protein [Paraburkholderia sp. DHOC27]RFU46925.1 hypothetical protein D0B32_12170 [Paraburkholderia sp. DHOC27]
MKTRAIVVVCLCVISSVAFARGDRYGGEERNYYSGSSGEHYVQGYTRNNGTYVEGHYQTNPNDTQYDNWSSKGNVNPYTGQEGTVYPSY